MKLEVNWPYSELPPVGTPVTLEGRKVGTVVKAAGAHGQRKVEIELEDRGAVMLASRHFDDLGVVVGDDL